MKKLSIRDISSPQIWGLLGHALWVTSLLLSSAQSSAALDRAAAALRIANDLGIPHNNDPKELYGLFPKVFPGGYNGELDVSYYQKETTWEHVVVALVRWSGWDTVHYDIAEIDRVKPYVSPEGFPYYSPDPTPRSIPYVIVALRRGLISDPLLRSLRKSVTAEDIDSLCERVKKLAAQEDILPTLTLDAGGMQHLSDAKKHPGQLVLLPTGFTHYEVLGDLPNRILDLNSPSLRLFNGSDSLANGKQDYFPLGPLETQLSVGLKVNRNSFSHQSESIYGSIENESTTANAVGIWGSASSLERNARVWGGFLVGSTAEGSKKDAQVVGLEVDVVNKALAGLAPNRSKVGIQIVGIGSQPLTNALEVIGAGQAKWANGLLFEKGAIYPGGAVIASSDNGELARGIDFSQTHFRDSAFSLSQGSRITFKNKSGAASMLYTDNFDLGHLVVQAGVSGLRITSNDDSKNLAIIDAAGNITTPKGDLNHTMDDVNELKRQAVTAPPKSSHDSCMPGARSEDADYIYVCVAMNQWRRARLAAW